MHLKAVSMNIPRGILHLFPFARVDVLPSPRVRSPVPLISVRDDTKSLLKLCRNDGETGSQKPNKKHGLKCVSHHNKIAVSYGMSLSCDAGSLTYNHL